MASSSSPRAVSSPQAPAAQVSPAPRTPKRTVHLQITPVQATASACGLPAVTFDIARIDAIPHPPPGTQPTFIPCGRNPQAPCISFPSFPLSCYQLLSTPTSFSISHPPLLNLQSHSDRQAVILSPDSRRPPPTTAIASIHFTSCPASILPLIAP